MPDIDVGGQLKAATARITPGPPPDVMALRAASSQARTRRYGAAVVAGGACLGVTFGVAAMVSDPGARSGDSVVQEPPVASRSSSLELTCAGPLRGAGSPDFFGEGGGMPTPEAAADVFLNDEASKDTTVKYHSTTSATVYAVRPDGTVRAVVEVTGTENGSSWLVETVEWCPGSVGP